MVAIKPFENLLSNFRTIEKKISKRTGNRYATKSLVIHLAGDRAAKAFKYLNLMADQASAG